MEAVRGHRNQNGEFWIAEWTCGSFVVCGRHKSCEPRIDTELHGCLSAKRAEGALGNCRYCKRNPGFEWLQCFRRLRRRRDLLQKLAAGKMAHELHGKSSKRCRGFAAGGEAARGDRSPGGAAGSFRGQRPLSASRPQNGEAASPLAQGLRLESRTLRER